MSNNPSLDTLLQRAMQTSGTPIQLGLERTERLLEQLDNPEKGVNTIHVAGTNGKGSVVAFMEAILLKAGLRVGAYTSPHLHHFCERVRINGQAVAEEEMANHLAQVMELPGAEEATFFERTTVAAFQCFHQHPLDWLLLETGLGGRLDATNVVQSRLSIITAIGLDHQDYLGESLLEIAWEKAGILKPHTPAAIDPGSPRAEAILRVTAAGRRAPLISRGREYDYRIHGQGWIFKDGKGTLTLPMPNLLGNHQVANAALAIAGLRAIAGLDINEEAIRYGITHAHWPGRLELVAGTPTIWLDGAHNPQAAQALAASMPALAPPPYTLVYSALADKDHMAMAEALAPITREVHLCTLDEPRAADPARIAAAWKVKNIPTFIHASPQLAVLTARHRTPADGVVLVTGSLHLVGTVRSEWLS
ncbi:MAG: bifunctional folylpolyglutamate synthase/dihydrofolate synthase [Magnetococcales bacterium]|nr:bifunctional folylpolyglutamate synthase/dihydrofolate synthase [Magnetococcales bacterium]NGZ27330.1 bifunctional folylpolyglutamate synthase/dihydrofolate synthase [Magnetococcales bacterium]